MGTRWLGDPACVAPVVLCGDLNTVPLFGVYRRFAEVLADASQLRRLGPRKDLSERVSIHAARPCVREPLTSRSSRSTVPRTRLTAIASDHLPLIARIVIRK